MEHSSLNEHDADHLHDWVELGESLERPSEEGHPAVVREIAGLLDLWDAPEPPPDLVDRTLTRAWSASRPGYDGRGRSATFDNRW